MAVLNRPYFERCGSSNLRVCVVCVCVLCVCVCVRGANPKRIVGGGGGGGTDTFFPTAASPKGSASPKKAE